MKKAFLVALVIIAIALIVFLIIMLSNDEESANTSANRNTYTSSANSGDELKINFKSCKVKKRTRIDVALGSTTYEIDGIDNKKCLFNYGNEIEEPDWDGILDTSCQVPVSLGEIKFRVTDLGVNFNAIEDYCETDIKTECKYVRDDIECDLRNDCLALDLCDCTTEMNRADKCGYGVPGDEMCLCDAGGFLYCEELFCPTDPSVCETDYCSNFTYSNCPGICAKDCIPSNCTGGICTDDCGGENSCYCP
ncbi:hypothetical protein KKG41_06345 [Patescibacteria group bacterium]|nr:hypothetical protein [Patescibacteria group bacterium]MBU1890768.1 hypothetical protein [Patescibacteria group bacterium]